jgi:ETC complex I subunit conserved region
VSSLNPFIIHTHTHTHTEYLVRSYSTPSIESQPSSKFPVKLSTGIVGLPVVPNGPEVLTYLYKLTLKELQALPEGIAYRTVVEKV